jgi:hypothetical protein
LFSVRSIAAPASQPAMESATPLSPEDRTAEAMLDHSFPQINLQAVGLGDTLNFLRDISNANIYADWKAIALAGVTPTTVTTLTAKDISLREVFKKILASTGADSLEIQVIHGVIVVSTKLNFADRQKQKGPYLAEFSDTDDASAVLKTKVSQLTMPAIPLSDFFSFLRDITGKSIEVNWKALSAAGIEKTTPISLNLRNCKVSSVLYFVLDQVGDGTLGYVIEPTQGMYYDKKLRKQVTEKLELIRISTIDDLVANRGGAATRPN